MWIHSTTPENTHLRHCTARIKLRLGSHLLFATMAPNDSRHLLPMNSMLFKEQPSPRPLATEYNPTLANLQEAQDTTITALPQPPSDEDVQPTKPSLCSTLLAAIKKLWPFGKAEKGLSIGEPTEFQHLQTAGPRPLMGPVRVSVGEVDDDWEDME
jgi:hypothetical protein